MGTPAVVILLQVALFSVVGLTFLSGVATCGVIVVGWYALDLYRPYQTREQAAARLEIQTSELNALLGESQLQRLRAQLEPAYAVEDDKQVFRNWPSGRVPKDLCEPVRPTARS